MCEKHYKSEYKNLPVSQHVYWINHSPLPRVPWFDFWLLQSVRLDFKSWPLLPP